MKKDSLFLALSVSALLTAGCAGIKVINPNDQNKNAGTLAVDVKDGQFKLVATYTCKLESIGNRFSALGKTEADAREEVLAKCRERTLLSFCQPEKVKCVQN